MPNVDQRCPTCFGSGKTTCSSCGGTGKLPCTWCSGRGQTGWGENARLCTSCGGGGTRTCTGCGGSTRVNCNACRGSGTKRVFVSDGSAPANKVEPTGGQGCLLPFALILGLSIWLSGYWFT